MPLCYMARPSKSLLHGPVPNHLVCDETKELQTERCQIICRWLLLKRSHSEVETGGATADLKVATVADHSVQLVHHADISICRALPGSPIGWRLLCSKAPLQYCGRQVWAHVQMRGEDERRVQFLAHSLDATTGKMSPNRVMKTWQEISESLLSFMTSSRDTFWQQPSPMHAG